MSDVTLLRTLTRKSIIGYARYRDLTVQNILDIRGFAGLNWLTWTYYRSSKISFTDDILIEIGITKKMKIDKPGKVADGDWALLNKAMDNRVNKLQEGKTEKELMDAVSHFRGVERRYKKGAMIRQEKSSKQTKGQAQRFNQGLR